MAPLSNVISPVGCSSPPFFGPPITEFNSFWYKLFIYHTAKSGPPSILLPQGTCLIITPKIFIGFELLYVATPEQAPLILQRANCLHIINEILKFSCVFIQGYSYDQEVNDKLAYIPFPISEKILALDCPRFKDLSQNLIENLNLNYGFGYITMIKIEKNMPKRSKSITLSECSKFGTSQPELFYENPVFEGIDPLQKLFNPDNIKIISSDNFDEFLSSKKYRWMPFDVVYGIPLFNDELNSKICSNVYIFITPLDN
uniref:Protein FAM91A1 (Trinotate prediction) n=1 Tax=Henneguya salminicola TaxID=69463 RepID=A0A6G3MFP8_HENSL